MDWVINSWLLNSQLITLKDILLSFDFQSIYVGSLSWVS